MRFPIALPRNHPRMTPGQLFEAAMERGIGKANKQKNQPALWSVEEICEALRQYYRDDPDKWDRDYIGTVNGWRKGNIPRKHRRAFFAIFTPDNRLENWQEWQNAFLDCWNRDKNSRKAKKEELNKEDGEGIRFDFGGPLPKPVTINSCVETAISQYWPGLKRSDLPLLSLNVLNHRVRQVYWGADKHPVASCEQLCTRLVYDAGWLAVARQLLALEHDKSIPVIPKDGVDWRAYAHYLVEDHPPFDKRFLFNPSGLPAVRYLHGKLNSSLCRDDICSRQFSDFFEEAFYIVSADYALEIEALFPALFASQSEADRSFATLAFHCHRLVIAGEAKAPMFADVHGQSGEPFSLQDIYIDLPLLNELLDRESNVVHQNIDQRISARQLVEDHVTGNWGIRPRSENFLIIRGAPGAGKSSVLREQVRRIVSDPSCADLAVMFVPLQRHGPFEERDQTLVLRGATPPGFSRQPHGIDLLDRFEKSSFERLLLIFDGLDELGRRDDKIVDVEQFSRVMQLTDLAAKRKPVKYIIAGRDQPFRHLDYPSDHERRSYRLLGLAEETVDYVRHSPVIENEHVRFVYDFRYDWLKKYSRYKLYNDTPKRPSLFDSALHPLYELTQEPLLLFLLCRLSSIVIEEQEKPQTGPDLNLDDVYNVEDSGGLNKNDVFQILIKSIRKPSHRNLAYHERSEKTGGIPEQQFEKVLACLAMPAWRNRSGRRATVRSFLDEAKREDLLEQAKKLVTIARGENIDHTASTHLSLLSVFYFRAYRSDTTDVDEFEFTHKSFATYLVAARLFRAAVELVLKFDRPDKRMEIHKLFQDWVTLTGGGEETLELHQFLLDEGYRYVRGTDALPEALGHLIQGIGEFPGDPAQRLPADKFEIIATNMFSRTFRCEGDDGSPVSPMIPAFQTQRRSFRIFFAVFGALVNAYGELEGERYKPRGPNFEEILRMISEPVSPEDLDSLGYEHTDFMAASLRYFDFSDHDFVGLNVSRGDFSFSDLSGAQFRNTLMNHAGFQKAVFSETDFVNCLMSESIFVDNVSCSFFDCVVRLAQFEGCSFHGARFERSDFSESVFNSCTFENCDFVLTGVDACEFVNCTFDGCTFRCCTLREAKMIGGTIIYASFVLCDTEEFQISPETECKNILGLI